MDPNSSTAEINDSDYSQYLASLFEPGTDSLELGKYFNGQNGDDDMNTDSGSMTSLDESDSLSATTSLQQPVDSDDSSDESDDWESESDDDWESEIDDNSSEDGETNDDKEAENVDEEGELNVGEIDGLFCPICFEAWSSGGDHAVCCLPCGHIYGLACIKKWLQGRGSGKCPQCKRKCSTLHIRVLYAGRIVAVDEELQKKNQSLKAKCAYLEKKNVEWQKKEAAMSKELQSFKELQQLVELGETNTREILRLQSSLTSMSAQIAELQHQQCLSK